jgi:hypothetical protein
MSTTLYAPPGLTSAVTPSSNPPIVVTSPTGLKTVVTSPPTVYVPSGNPPTVNAQPGDVAALAEMGFMTAAQYANNVASLQPNAIDRTTVAVNGVAYVLDQNGFTTSANLSNPSVAADYERTVESWVTGGTD